MKMCSGKVILSPLSSRVDHVRIFWTFLPTAVMTIGSLRNENHNGGAIENVAKQIFNERNNGSYVHNDSWFISLRALQTNNGEPQQIIFLNIYFEFTLRHIFRFR